MDRHGDELNQTAISAEESKYSLDICGKSNEILHKCYVLLAKAQIATSKGIISMKKANILDCVHSEKLGLAEKQRRQFKPSYYFQAQRTSACEEHQTRLFSPPEFLSTLWNGRQEVSPRQGDVLTALRLSFVPCEVDVYKGR